MHALYNERHTWAKIEVKIIYINTKVMGTLLHMKILIIKLRGQRSMKRRQRYIWQRNVAIFYLNDADIAWRYRPVDTDGHSSRLARREWYVDILMHWAPPSSDSPCQTKNIMLSNKIQRLSESSYQSAYRRILAMVAWRAVSWLCSVEK